MNHLAVYKKLKKHCKSAVLQLKKKNYYYTIIKRKITQIFKYEKHINKLNVS